MKIVCPQCEFAREVPAEKLPSSAVTATCPQCQHRFKVMRDDGTSATYADDVIPFGAHIPSTDEPLYTQATQNNSELNSMQGTVNADNNLSQSSGAEEITDEERQRAAQAYAEQANAENIEDNFSVANPWEYVAQHGYFAAFYQTVIWVLFAPSRFFAGLVPQNSRVHILIFYLIVRTLQISFEFFWGSVLSSMLETSAANDPELKVVIELLTPQTDILLALLIGTALATIELFLGSLFYFAIFRIIAASQANFSLVFQSLAYSSAPLLLAIIPALGTIVGFIWSLACLIIGCRYTMRLSWSQTILGIAPLYALGILLLLNFVNSIAM